VSIRARLARAGLVFLLSIATLYVAGVGLLYVQQERLLFPAPAGPFDAAEGFEQVTIRSGDGTRLDALYLGGPHGAPSVVFFHGNGSVAARETNRALRLNRAGFSVLLAEYRGYGGSEGTPGEEGLIADGLASFDWLKSRSGTSPIFAYGHSLGTGVALAVASARPVDAVALEAPYSSIADVAGYRYPWVPISMLLRHPFRSDLRIASIEAPILIMHGTEDAVVPIGLGRSLYEKALDAQWIEYAQAGHRLADTDSVERAAAFFEASMPPR